MPNFDTHKKICDNQGYNSTLCITINRWMDEPAAQFPGCQHRNFRHSQKDCDSIHREILRKINNIPFAEEGKAVCRLHRIIDRRNDKGCGCRPLFDEFDF